LSHVKGDARAEGNREKIEGRGTGVVAAVGAWLIRDEHVVAHADLELEIVFRCNDDGWLDGGHEWKVGHRSREICRAGRAWHLAS